MPKAVRKRSSKISFQKEFYSDLSMSDMINAVTIRSPAQKGILMAVSHPDLPEGYTIVTARDVPGTNFIDTPCGKVPVFCDGNISYLGEPIGLLAGPDLSRLYEILSELKISVDENPIESFLQDVQDVQEIPAADGTALQDAIEDLPSDDLFSTVIARREKQYGPCFEKDKEGKIPGIESVLDSAPHLIKRCWQYSMTTPYYGEPNGALCDWKDGENLTICTPTQWLSSLRQIASSALNIKTENITVKKTSSSNTGTNGIWFNSILACQVAIASKKAHKPVKLVYSRDEQEKFLDSMRPITITHVTAADDSGKLLAMKIDIDVDAGFSNPFAQETIDRLVIASSGIYRPQSLSVTATAYRSLTPASSVDVQIIDSAALFALENQMNEMAAECSLLPAEIRERNIIAAKKNIKNQYPFTFQTENFHDLALAITQASDLNRKYSAYHLEAKNRKIRGNDTEYDAVYSSPLRGIGFSFAFEGSGYYGSNVYGNDQSLEVTLETDQTLTIHCPPVSSTVEEIWYKLAADELGINQSAVKINSSFKADEEPPLPENVYSNISVMTVLLKKCCAAIKKRKEGTALPYTVKKKITPAQKKEWNKESFSGTPFHSTSFASAVVEIELDPCTYREIVRGISIVIYGGQILNRKAAESRIRLSIQKVLSSLVSNDTIDCKNIKVMFMKSNESPMQIGEIAYNVIPAAYTQALSQALGCTMTSLPLQTDSVYYKLCEQKIYENAENVAKKMGEQVKEETTDDNNSDNK